MTLVPCSNVARSIYGVPNNAPLDVEPKRPSSLHTGELVGNNTSITVTAAELKDRTPLFVKEGAVIPMFAKAPLNSTAAKGQDMIVRHYGNEAGSCELYEDDATTFDYQRGASRIRTLCVDADGTLDLKVEGNGPTLFGKILNVEQMTK